MKSRVARSSESALSTRSEPSERIPLAACWAAAARDAASGATTITSIVSRDGARCASFSAAITDGVSPGSSAEKSVCSGKWNAASQIAMPTRAALNAKITCVFRWIHWTYRCVRICGQQRNPHAAAQRLQNLANPVKAVESSTR